jgi:LCP family protein required for cell wall assembly
VTDEPRDETLDEEKGEEPEAPTPATWAGKTRAGADDAGEHEIPTEVAAPADAADPAVEADAADEAEEPPDEFEFDEDAGEGRDGDEVDEPGEPEGDEIDADSDQDLDEELAAAVPSSQETIEADTLAVADSEEAKEAALAGLKARTAEHAAKLEAAKTPSTEDGAKAKPPVPSKPAPAEPAEGDEADGEDEKSKSRGLWPRFVAASFLIVVSMATATAVSLLVYLTDVAKGLGGLDVPGLTAVESGQPQNFLILGSDKRSDTPGDPGRSDTTILLRINPDLNVISMMSIPRDLKVNIPGHGIDKFNAAYSYGGPKKTLQTVKQLTQHRIPVNHIVNVDFQGFADAVDAIGCVYIDVDRHYYIPPNSGIAEIDIQAGYQRLCGYKALQYVRYRHTDTDLVRSARQQDFLREARQAVPPSKLLDDYDELTDILKKYTTSDINGPATLLNLGKLIFAAKDAPVQEIHFPTTSLGDSSGYVTSNSELVQKAVSQFLSPSGVATQASQGGSAKKGEKEGKGHGGGGEKPKPETPPPVPLIDSTASGQEYAELLQNTQHKQSGKPLLDFPIFYPTMLTPGSAIDDESRAFVIDGPGNDVYYGYRFVVTVPGAPGAGFPTAYYGVSGTDWKDPPILANPSEEREIDGRTYQLFYDGDRLRLVSFKTDQGSYWVINSLTQQLSAGQMLGIAQNMREYTG